MSKQRNIINQTILVELGQKTFVTSHRFVTNVQKLTFIENQ